MTKRIRGGNVTQDYQKIAETAIMAGQIMLESHAESYRVEETTRHILKISGLPITEVMSTTTALFISLGDEHGKMNPISMVRRIESRTNRLGRIYRVNSISRQLTSNKMSIDEAYDQLVEIREEPNDFFSMDIANILMVTAFVILLNGTWVDLLISPIVGLIVASARFIRKTFNLNYFIYGSTTTFLTAFIVYLIGLFLPWPVSEDLLIIAGLMPLYPGTVVTNGIRDMLKGDYVSGVARITEAIVTAVSLAIGVALGLLVYREVLRWLL